MMLDKSAQAGQHAYKERAQDLYETPVCAIEALVRVEKLPFALWEPACGPGKIVEVLRLHGHQVLASDLFDYGDSTHFYGRDFLTEKLPKNVEGIITNPPYQLAAEFVRHALWIKCPYVAMLLRLAFLESEGRGDILDVRAPARIHVFKKRLPMMHRAGWQGKKASSAIAFAWFVWDGYPPYTTIDRI